MYFDNKVYFKLIMQTNYDKIVDLKENIVSFSPFHNNFTKAILVRRQDRSGTARTALPVRLCLLPTPTCFA